ncbi:MAG: YgjV family protein [Gammaproteobacteria bacterium]|jgi:hypothetical protein|nr:YgjV family protein [Gammaproteobacteria bacterium]
MSSFVISQILAGGTFVTGLIAFQLSNRVHMLRTWGLAATFGAAHFWFLGAPEASLLVAITASRFYISSFTTDQRLMYLFLAIAVGGFAATYSAPISLLALAATLIGTYGSFYGTENAFRYSMLAAQILWFIHNYVVWSPVALGMEFFFFASNILGWVRHRRAQAQAQL